MLNFLAKCIICFKPGKCNNIYVKVLWIILIIVLYFMLKVFDENDQIISRDHFIINSAFYYNISKFYAPNTVAILINSERKHFANKDSFQCFSKNATTTLISKMDARMDVNYAKENLCSWDYFIANCSTVLNPIYFGLKTIDNSEKIVEINLEYPEQKKYPVVMCFPPMIYEARWQQIIFATEIYHYFGTDLQIQYINSVMKEIFELVQVYESKGWVKIQGFPFFDFSNETVSEIGVHPMLELDSRNQALALTDCLMRYRESAEFAIIGDIDDILIPFHGNFYKEFSHCSKVNPQATAFFYMRSLAKIDVAPDFKNFSISDTINSFVTSEKASELFGKSVYQTKYTESVLIHIPRMSNDILVKIPMDKGRMYHVQIDTKYMHGAALSTFKPFQKISKAASESMETEFASTFKNFPSIKENFIYADAIFECYTKYAKWYSEGQKPEMPKSCHCLNPIKCKKPEIVPNFKCNVARRDFVTTVLSKDTVLHVPKREFQWWTNKNGCNIFLN